MVTLQQFKNSEKLDVSEAFLSQDDIDCLLRGHPQISESPTRNTLVEAKEELAYWAGVVDGLSGTVKFRNHA